MTAVRFVVTRPAEGSDVAELAVEGEIDVSNVEEFGQGVAECLQSSCRVLSMNMAGLTFIDSSGLRVIVETVKKMKEREGELLITHPPAILRRIVEVSGLSEFLGIAEEGSTSA